MLLIDRNSKKEALEMVQFLNEKMVTDIEYSIFTEENDLGIVSHSISFKVYTMHFGLGEISDYFHVHGLCDWNLNVLIENIESNFKGIKGLKIHHKIKGSYTFIA